MNQCFYLFISQGGVMHSVSSLKQQKNTHHARTYSAINSNHVLVLGLKLRADDLLPLNCMQCPSQDNEAGLPAYHA